MTLSLLPAPTPPSRGIGDTPPTQSQELRPSLQRWLSHIPAGRLAQVTEP